MNYRQLVSGLPFDQYVPNELLKLQRRALTISTAVCLSAAAMALPTGRAILLACAVVSYKATDAYLEGRYGFLQRFDNSLAIFRRKLLRSTLTLVVVSGLLFSELGLVAAIAAAGVLNIGLLFSAEKLNLVQPRERPMNSKGFRRLVVAGLTTGAASGVDSLVVMLPRFALGTSGRLEDVAVFTILVQIPIVMAIVASGFGQALIPRLLAASNGGERFSQLIRALFLASLLGIVGIVVALSWGSEILSALYGARFSGYSQSLTLVMIGATFWYLATVAGYALVGIGRYSDNLLAVVCATLVAGVLLIVPSDLTISSAITAYIAAMVVRAVIGLGMALNGILRRCHDG